MGKLVAILGIAVVGFLAAVVGMLAVSGNLNKEAVDSLLGRGTEIASETSPVDDPSSVLVKELKLERERLVQKQRDLDAREEQLKLREQEVDTTLTDIQTIQEQITEAMNTLDAAQESNLKDLSETLENMKAQEAADALEAMDPKDAVKLLPLIKEKDRGKIMDSMKDKDKRATLFELLQERLY
jgi:flagellar motility protein MotE (MotC chaperone)